MISNATKYTSSLKVIVSGLIAFEKGDEVDYWKFVRSLKTWKCCLAEPGMTNVIMAHINMYKYPIYFTPSTYEHVYGTILQSESDGGAVHTCVKVLIAITSYINLIESMIERNFGIDYNLFHNVDDMMENVEAVKRQRTRLAELLELIVSLENVSPKTWNVLFEYTMALPERSSICFYLACSQDSCDAFAKFLKKSSKSHPLRKVFGEIVRSISQQ